MPQKAREIPQKTVICQSEVDANVNMLSRLYRGNLSRVSYKKEIFRRTRPSCDSKKFCKIKRNDVTLKLMWRFDVAQISRFIIINLYQWYLQPRL